MVSHLEMSTVYLVDYLDRKQILYYDLSNHRRPREEKAARLEDCRGFGVLASGGIAGVYSDGATLHLCYRRQAIDLQASNVEVSCKKSWLGLRRSFVVLIGREEVLRTDYWASYLRDPRQLIDFLSWDDLDSELADFFLYICRLSRDKMALTNLTRLWIRGMVPPA
jgi:hypothetical protein